MNSPVSFLTNLGQDRLQRSEMCSPNFPRASYLDERTLTYEPIVKCSDRHSAAQSESDIV